MNFGIAYSIGVTPFVFLSATTFKYFPMKNKSIEFCDKTLGAGQPAFIDAEVGFNHNGDVELAKKMIQSASENGADAVKLQTFIAQEMISKSLIVDLSLIHI